MKNVVLLTIDTLRKDVLGCYGSQANLTPFLDSLAGNSMIFDRYMSAGPYTQASFPAILSSSYFLEYGNPKKLSDKRTLISEVVKKGGFSTAAFHSNPYLSEFFGWNKGWDEFYDSMRDEVTPEIPYIRGDVINNKVGQWLQSHTIGGDYKPFFLWVHYMDIHEPYVPEQKYVDKVDPSIQLSAPEMMALFKEVLLPRDTSDPDNITLLKKLYLAHINQVDEYAGELFGILDYLKLLDNTIFIVTTDHGDEFGDHGSLSHDGKMNSELINIPLIIYDKDIPRTVRVDKLMSTVDIAPTITAHFGLDKPDTWHGQSMLPLDKYTSKGVFGEAIGKNTHKVRESDRVIHFYQEKNLKITHRSEDDTWTLFDLERDPNENNNIIESHPLANEMKDKLRSQITWWDLTNEPVFCVSRF